MLSISRNKVISVCIYSVYSFSQADRNRKFWILSFNLLLKQKYASNYDSNHTNNCTSYNASGKKADINS